MENHKQILRDLFNDFDVLTKLEMKDPEIQIGIDQLVADTIDLIFSKTEQSEIKDIMDKQVDHLELIREWAFKKD